MVIAHSWPQVTTVGPSLVTFAVAVRVFNVLAVAEHFDPLKWHRDIENCEASVKKKKIADIHSISVSSAHYAMTFTSLEPASCYDCRS